MSVLGVISSTPSGLSVELFVLNLAKDSVLLVIAYLCFSKIFSQTLQVSFSPSAASSVSVLA